MHTKAAESFRYVPITFAHFRPWHLIQYTINLSLLTSIRHEFLKSFKIIYISIDYYIYRRTIKKTRSNTNDILIITKIQDKQLNFHIWFLILCIIWNICCSCCCDSILHLLGPISRATIDRYIWY